MTFDWLSISLPPWGYRSCYPPDHQRTWTRIRLKMWVRCINEGFCWGTEKQTNPLHICLTMSWANGAPALTLPNQLPLSDTPGQTGPAQAQPVLYWTCSSSVRENKINTPEGTEAAFLHMFWFDHLSLSLAKVILPILGISHFSLQTLIKQNHLRLNDLLHSV